MDHGAPPWLSQPQTKETIEMDPWSRMHLHPPPHHYRNSNYGYYQQPYRADPHQAWSDPWLDYYSQQPPRTHHQREWGRPPSRAEIYQRTEVQRTLSRQGYDERYGYYDATSRDYAYQVHYHNRQTPVPDDYDRIRATQSSQTQQWVHSQRRYPEDQVSTSDKQPRTDGQNWNQGYENSSDLISNSERNEEAMGKLEPFCPVEPSLLSQYRDSGMSSSSYELSQYMHDSTDFIGHGSWSNKPSEASVCTPQPTTPMKFSLPHVSVCFGARGHLVRVCPNFPADGQPAIVEIHSLEVILNETAEQEEIRNFPGPVQREDLHKVDIMNFCQQNIEQCLRSGSPQRRDDALLWQMLLQMCRQNGCIAGSDVAELLLQNCKRDRYQREQPKTNLINLDMEPPLMMDVGPVDLLTGEMPSAEETSAQAVEKYTRLLFFGRKKATLEWAMKHNLWGHAFFLSSKMDPRAYSWVMTRFTSTLAQNDPLQTLFQLMAGRTPQASTCSGDTKWGDWRPHLAVLLSNQTADSDLNRRAIITMGDNLVLKGFTEAGHCCYLTAGTPFGHYYEKSDRLVLLGSSHSQTFKKFATSQSIQRTEILEYCQSLGKPNHCIPYFQLAERLRFSDPRLLDLPELKQHHEPEWLLQLRSLLRELQEETDAGKQLPAHYASPRDQTGGTETPILQEEHQCPQEDYCVLEEQTVQKSVEQGTAWTTEYTQQLPVAVQGDNNSQWAPSEPPPNSAVPSSGHIYEDQQINGPPPECTLMEGSTEPYPITSFGNTDHSKQSLITRRIRTVSETSSISVEEDEEESEEPSATESNKNKGSGFGWFGWFRSRPAKDTAATEEETPKTTDSTIQEDPSTTREMPSLPPPPLSTSHLPPPPNIPTSHTQTNPFSRSSGIKKIEEQQNIKSNLEFPGSQSHPENVVTPPDRNAGNIPLYNPSQFYSGTGQIMNKPSQPFRRRYPIQPS
ncbi:protein transport protein Sec16B isoform X2 [Bombina bombina]|uniref:protein transport protein Sec16B isoform X2 n=1 Tax=Bombina bombina TaxID=8345 RepID=UPI00235A772E|nr:protein transport protein Sec16B isoform X2 [Bombina bombina]